MVKRFLIRALLVLAVFSTLAPGCGEGPGTIKLVDGRTVRCDDIESDWDTEGWWCSIDGQSPRLYAPGGVEYVEYDHL